MLTENVDQLPSSPSQIQEGATEKGAGTMPVVDTLLVARAGYVVQVSMSPTTERNQKRFPMLNGMNSYGLATQAGNYSSI